MSAPLTKTQLPLEAILDLFGKQTYLGNSFILPMTGKSLADTSETSLAVIRNPSTSGKSIFLVSRRFSTDLNPVLVKVYVNSVLNVPGSTTTPLNLRSGATTASISQSYLGASFTNNGTLLWTTAATLAVPALETLLYVIDPGTNALLTATQVGVGTSVVQSQLAWYEI